MKYNISVEAEIEADNVQEAVLKFMAGTVTIAVSEPHPDAPLGYIVREYDCILIQATRLGGI